MEQIEEDEKIYGRIEKIFIQNRKIYQYVYGKCCPGAYSTPEEKSINLKNEFWLKFLSER